MKINEAAKISNVTVRTLHYYDEIGLLKPTKVTESGYRIYDDQALETLQQILFFRELDFPLNEIKEIMQSPGYDRTEALRKHKELLIKKRQHIDEMIQLVEKSLKGEKDMSFKAFDQSEIESMKEQYAEEVKARWGKTQAYKESKGKTAQYSGEEWKKIMEEQNEIFKAFAEKRKESCEQEEVQQLVKRWQDFITDKFYECTNEILAGLGQMYALDERFKANIDQFGEGTAMFMSKAIAVYCNK